MDQPVSTTSKTTLPGNTKLPSSETELQALMDLGAKGNFTYVVEDFFRIPERSRYQLSPAGDYFSYLGPVNRRQNLFIQKVGSDKAIAITNETARNISSYFWASKDRLIYLKDSAGDENFQLFAVNKDGSKPLDLTPYEGVLIQVIDDLPDNEDEIIIGMNKNNPQLFDPYRLNIHTGEVTQLAENINPLEPIDSWMTDHEGKLRLASKLVGGTNTTLLYREKESDPFKEVITTDFRTTIQPLFFEFDNSSIVYCASNLGRDKSAIIRFDMATAKEIAPPIYFHDEVDVNQLHYSRKYKKLTSITYNTTKWQHHFLDKDAARTQEYLESKLPGYEVFIVSHNKAEDKLMIRTYSDRSLGAYYFYDKTNNEFQHITDVSPWLNEDHMTPMKPITYTSRDGLTIHGYLSLPTGQPAKNLPVVINPHGGPWHRDSWGFNPEVQLLASRGYAVLQMNFRGSTGYGREFWEKSFKQWGQRMQDDISDGVQWLVDQGIADPDRIAIYGGSYGGYATLAGVTFTPDLYACGIDYVGVSNLFSFLTTIPPYWKPYLEMMYEMVGHPEKDAAMMEANSPVKHVDQIKAPLFVIQGANDPRVNIDESDQIVQQLRDREIDVPYMVRYDEGHGFNNEENRFMVYKAILGFLKKHI